jgi:hypothetical protein
MMMDTSTLHSLNYHDTPECTNVLQVLIVFGLIKALSIVQNTSKI